MSSYEFAEWEAVYEMEPFGDIREDLRAALICKVLADINTDPKKEKMELADFMLTFKKKEQTPEEMLQQAEMANFAFGGIDTRPETED